MCGIVGAITKDNSAFDSVFEGLKVLEYRGYDSFGFGFSKNGKIFVEKKVGRIGDAKKVFSDSNVCIGHTRWATHGKVTESNAHPHVSNNKKIAAVHNGIIENYAELKESLVYAGFKFYSETDSEIIPNLIEFYMESGQKDFVTATITALERIEGSYSVVLMHSEFDGLLGARNGSPLVLGIGENDFFLASDIPAFLKHTKKAVYLNDLEMAVIGNGVWKVFDLAKNVESKKTVSEINWSFEQAQKGEFSHFMLKEIFEQPRTIPAAAKQEKEKILNAVKMIKDAKGIFFVGCGTSFHSCVSGAYFFSDAAGKHVNTCIASEFENLVSFLNNQSLVVAVSQSGETADVIDAVKAAKEKGAKTVAIVNVMGSTLTRLCDETLLMNTGPEICVLSTKTYTAQLSVLYLLAMGAAGKLEDAKKHIEETAVQVKTIIEANNEKAKVLAKKIAKKNNIFLIGRGHAYPSTLEGALKIKEVSYIHAEGFAGGELKHGTIALIEELTPVIVLSTENTCKKIFSNAQEVKARGAYLIGVGSGEMKEFDFSFEVPNAGYLDSINLIIPIQLLSYYLAIERGCDPDKPKNLAKAVTVR
jgi:glutamine---fructose-6-phosphate transaminase (isomerizing)